MCQRGSGSEKIVDAEDRHDLVADKEIENENDDQGRKVTHELNIGACDHSVEQAFADSQQSHCHAEKSGQQGSPEAQAQGGQQPMDQVVGYPLAGFRIVPEKILGDDSPLPVIVELDLDLINNIYQRPEEGEQYKNVKRGDFTLLLQHRVSPAGGFEIFRVQRTRRGAPPEEDGFC